MSAIKYDFTSYRWREDAWMDFGKYYDLLDRTGDSPRNRIRFALPPDAIKEAYSEIRNGELDAVLDFDKLSQQLIAVKITKDDPVALAAMEREIEFEEIIQETLKKDEYALSKHFQRFDYHATFDVGAFYCTDIIPDKLTLKHLRQAANTNKLVLPDELIFHLLGQFIKVIRFLHERCHVVHNDLAREKNIMVRYDPWHGLYVPEIVLVDFAEARKVDGAETKRAWTETAQVFRLLLDLMEAGHDLTVKDEPVKENVTTLFPKKVHTKDWRELHVLLKEGEAKLSELEDKFSGACEKASERLSNSASVKKAVYKLLDKAIEEVEKENEGALPMTRMLECSIDSFAYEERK